MADSTFEKGSGGHRDGPAEIHVRNIHFDAIKDLDMRNWHSGNPVLSQFFNGLSIMFPDGEAFFVNSVRNYAKDIKDPSLKAHVKGFMTQESIHSREHEIYNDALIEQKLPAKPLLNANKKGLDWAARHFPKSSQLADTCAAEHFTAILADMLLTDERFMGGAPKEMADLWRWHAIEETEHKAVAFDVFQATHPGLKGYLIRTGTMLFTAIGFPFGMMLNMLVLLYGAGDLFKFKAWAEALKWFWISPAFMPRLFLRILPYFKPGFHPWQEQNYQFVEEWNRAHADEEAEDGSYNGVVTAA